MVFFHGNGPSRLSMQRIELIRKVDTKGPRVYLFSLLSEPLRRLVKLGATLEIVHAARLFCLISPDFFRATGLFWSLS